MSDPINWNDAFATARLVRDVVVLHQSDALPLDLMPVKRLGGASLFEVCVAFYILDCDRQEIAGLFEAASDVSKSTEQLEDFVLEMRSCAQLDFQRIGFFTTT